MSATPRTVALRAAHKWAVNDEETWNGVAEIEAENVRLRDFVSMWLHDGALQTFKNREKFRAEGWAMLNAARKVKATD